MSMENLQREIKVGNLVLRCPDCKKPFLQASELQNDLLQCAECSASSPSIEWVTLIKRKGDKSPHTFLSIEMGVSKKEGDDVPRGYFVCIETSEQSKEDYTETVAFCAGNAGGRSNAVRDKATKICPDFTTSGYMEAYFDSGGGTLKIFRGKDEADIYMKTFRNEDAIFHGASVYFALEHAFTPHIRELIQAILTDMKSDMESLPI